MSKIFGISIFWNKLLPVKHILALLTWGQKSTVSEQQPLSDFYNFSTEHPVAQPLTQRSVMYGWE